MLVLANYISKRETHIFQNEEQIISSWWLWPMLWSLVKLEQDRLSETKLVSILGNTIDQNPTS
jgi:hypothetical protein